jgi:hypothetical protein
METELPPASVQAATVGFETIKRRVKLEASNSPPPPQR